MCRKWTGALIYQYLSISPDQVSPPLDTFATYREYPSSPGRYRGFCGQCGSSLIWRSERESELESCDLLLGSIDERWLVGGGFGKLLCKPSGAQHWRGNAIEGVTDFLQGGRIYLAGKEAVWTACGIIPWHLKSLLFY
ncbi:uncharacterized protein APUU_22187S [Aspergillus puulaauensis]|uniref:CENP-V/GFA domain-containing protein n=1 Tax=Aspergillus puulaauensis TaxID=1220207 RepID=A0A7R7XHY1_9EURO|nr:uncharacterized protein APUU_22187S [Aspergillus puulaauensis]BCS21755.1 hypothetical protein APUU_22187S [Aspergillus puulaauensis]